MRIIDSVRADLSKHAASCGGRVVGVALNPDDHRQLHLAELWGMPILAWTEVVAGRYQLLCEEDGVLIPHIDTFEELADHWAFQLEAPASKPA